MNQVIQNIGVLGLFIGALYFLATKFIWKSTVKKNKNNSCGTNGNCGCS